MEAWFIGKFIKSRCVLVFHDTNTKKPSFIETGLAHAETCMCAFENLEGADKVNSEVSAFQPEEAGRWSSKLVTGRS